VGSCLFTVEAMKSISLCWLTAPSIGVTLRSSLRYLVLVVLVDLGCIKIREWKLVYDSTVCRLRSQLLYTFRGNNVMKVTTTYFSRYRKVFIH